MAKDQSATVGQSKDEAVDQAIDQGLRALVQRQHPDGHLVFDLEADATIPAEYILLNHFLDETEPDLEAQLCDYIRSIQGDHGGWPLFYGGDLDLSCSVKAYYALKIGGDDPQAKHMQRAREAILDAGGAERSNVFTRYQLALYGEVPWAATPVMPVELMLLPDWFPVTIWRMSYWSRTVIAPLLIIAALKPKAVNPSDVHISELFVIPPDQVRDWHKNSTGHILGHFFLGLDKLLRLVEPYFPKRLRNKAIKAAVDYMKPRLDGKEGLGAIYPAMANAVMAMTALGYASNHPDLVLAKEAIKRLVSRKSDKLFIQPCLSPVWDTCLSLHAMMDAGVEVDECHKTDAKGHHQASVNDNVQDPLCSGADWLQSKQILDVRGDWAENTAPDIQPGGWAFQYDNAHFPDVDDTAVVGMALHRINPVKYGENIQRAADWVIGMQSSNGGWGAFDVDNNASYLNHIPFADHGALLDPPTEDVSARCISFLAQVGYTRDHLAVARGIDYLRQTQQPNGSWYGRWGTNYIYGTWSVLNALNAIGEPNSSPIVRRAVNFLIRTQGEDGGWGEDGSTYYKGREGDRKSSTASQTAWAVMGLIAAGEVDSEAVERGIDYLISAPRDQDGFWQEPWYTAVGFPRVFYLRYHGYRSFFPLMALGKYRTMSMSNSKKLEWGI